MANKCRIPRINSKSASPEADLQTFCNTELIPQLRSIYNNPEYWNDEVISPHKVKTATIVLLQSLGQKYAMQDHKYIQQALNLVLQRPFYKLFLQLIPSGNIMQFIQYQGSAEEASSQITTDEIFDDEFGDNIPVDLFLKNAYNQAVLAKQLLERKMNNMVLNSFIINRSSGVIISNMQEATRKIKQNKVTLLLDVQNYFTAHNIRTPFTSETINEDNVEIIMNKYKKIISEHLQVGIFSGSELQSFYEKTYNDANISYEDKNLAKTTLDAYGSWLALRHFDDFIKLTVGDTIIINPASKNERYTFSKKGTNMNTTWRKNEDIDLTAEINKLVQALINTSPMVQFGTSTPINDAYLQFGDFGYITAKIKDLIYHPEASRFILTPTNIVYKQLTQAEQTLVVNMSLRQLICNTRTNPLKYLPIIYKILTSFDGTIPILNKFGKVFNSLDFNIIWTIYKTLYDTNFNGMENFHSIYSILTQNPDSKNIFAAVSSVADCIFSVNFVHYVYEDGIIKMRTLRDASVNKTNLEIRDIINTKNSKQFLGAFDFNKYDVEEIRKENLLNGISFKLNLSNNQPLYIHVTDMGKSVKLSKFANYNGLSLKPQELIALDKDPVVLDFFEHVLGLNLNRNDKFRNTLKELLKEGNDMDSPYIRQMFSLSGSVFFNRYFSQTYLDQRPFKKGKIATIKTYFTKDDNKPKFNSKFFTMDMIPSNKHEFILKIAQALGTTRGINSSRQVKDSDNAMLNSQSLSRLLGNLPLLLETQINAYRQLRNLEAKLAEAIQNRDQSIFEKAKTTYQNQINTILAQILQLKLNFNLLDLNLNPAAMDLSIITSPDLFKGIMKSEEIKGLRNNKKQVKFTTAEAITSSFLHNFVLGFCKKDLLEYDSTLGDNTIGLLPSVNSDKNTVGIGVFNLNASVGNSDLIFANLTLELLQDQIRKELGNYYVTMYNNVKKDFEALSFDDVFPLKITIDPSENFAQLNDYAKKINKTAYEVLMDRVQLYNKHHPKNPIKIIDQVHCIMDPKTGSLKTNNTIKSLIERFSSPKNTQEFFDIKNTEVLKSLLDTDFNINLWGNPSLSNQPEIAYLRSKHHSWDGKNWCDYNSGRMILAKVKIGNRMIPIISKNDINKLETALTIELLEHALTTDLLAKAGVENAEDYYYKYPKEAKKMCGYNKLLLKMHLLKGKITLHPMLEKYNLMDYFFTQLVLAVSVGSHVNHPAKGNFNPYTSTEQLLNNDVYETSFGAKISVEFATDILSIENPAITVAAQFNKVNQTITLDIEKIEELYNNKAWIIPFQFEDGSLNSVLPADTFTTFDEFLTFIIELKSYHSIYAQKPEELKGDYETRINNYALAGMRFKRLREDLAEEASRFYAQHKRNVSFTAAMHQFQLNQIDGIPSSYNIAIIEDIDEDVFTIDGFTNNNKPYDGATFVNPIIMYLENNSLNEAKAGIDKKQFVHFYDEFTGTGGIIKTAGFALTNDRMRNYKFYRYMMRNMCDKVWKDYLGNNYEANILVDFKHRAVDYGTFYFKQNGEYYEARIEKGDAPNSYIRTMTPINQDGSVKGLPKKPLIENVNTNYKLWQLFGGMHSQAFKNGLLQPSETSLELVTKAVINTGELKPNYIEGDITSEYIDQPLKNADIHYVPTIGAVKQGAANINSKNCYTKYCELNSYKIKVTNAGIQLDKEHHADDSKLSLMTLVISSACSMGYTQKSAKKLYKALYNLTTQGIKEFKDGFLEILNKGDSAKFEQVIAECMIKNMLNSTALDGDMLRAIASDLLEKARKGEELTFADASTIPYSDPAVFDKLVTNLSVIMTKTGIKAKMSGILSVLCPTQGIVKTYNFVDPNTNQRHSYTLSQIEDFLGGDIDDHIFNLQENQPFYSLDENNFHLFEVGNKYLVNLNGVKTILNIKFPHTYLGKIEMRTFDGLYENLPELVVGYATLINLIQSGQITEIKEWIVDGKELGSINYKFKGSDGKNYLVWDIDFIQDLFDLILKTKKKPDDEEKYKQFLDLIFKYEGTLDNFEQAVQHHFLTYQNGGTEYIPHLIKLAKLYIKQMQLDILFALSINNPTKVNTVRIRGNDIKIDKKSIQVLPYEIVMPKLFLKQFGLDEYANLNDIVNNPNYFYELMVHNFNTKVLDTNHYDVELKCVSGNHIYLKDTSGMDANWDQDLDLVNIHKKIDEFGNIWRIDPTTGEKMYRLFSDSDKVYNIPGTDTEIIATSINQTQNSETDEVITKSGITFYLDQFKYQALHISDGIQDEHRPTILPNNRPTFDNILDYINASKNKTAKHWLYIFKEGEHYVRDKVTLNLELNDFELLGNKFKKLLQEQALEVHSSFLKSLEIIAARIPAQNQQSFMPMKVVAFDNPNINTAYVSNMQFFLQGSDLDIDAVSLLTYAFDKNGEFYDWSPFFNKKDLEMLNLSMKLPFPTGNELMIYDYGKGEHVEERNRHTLLINTPQYLALLNCHEKLKALEDTTNPDNTNLIREDYQILKNEYEKEYLELFINLLEYVEKSGGIVYVDPANHQTDLEFFKLVLNDIDAHNLYFNKAGNDITQNAIKNYAVSLLYSISTDAANLLEAHTAVDVATQPLKKIANASELSLVQRTFTPGNVVNKFQAIEEASVGKDDIAICATGLKAFFAATQFCNDFLTHNLSGDMDKDTTDLISSIVTFKPITIGGRTFSSLANIRVDDLDKLVNNQSEIYKILKDRGFDEDASVVMSALLSLSTDNAKDLCLAKINAGTGMIGLYLYGAAIGMDFEVLNRIIASPLGFTIAKLLNSNEFTAKQGKTSVDSAISYLFDGPKAEDLASFLMVLAPDTTVHKLFIETFEQVIENKREELEQEKLNVPETFSIKNIGKFISTLTRFKGDFYTKSLLEQTKSAVNKKIGVLNYDYIIKNNFRALTNQLIDHLIEFSRQANSLRHTKYKTVYGESDLKWDLSKLALGADEFKRLGLFLRLNQEIKTKPDEFIAFVENIENLIVERLTLIKKTNKRLGIEQDLPKDVLPFDFRQFIRSYLTNPNDSNAYHNLQIEFYEDHCKTCINPLRVLTQVDHYKGYLESMIMAYEGDYIKSSKFRAIKNIGTDFIKKVDIKAKKDKTNTYKGVKSLVDDYINNAFLESRGLFILPKSQSKCPIHIVKKDGSTMENKFTESPIKLGTIAGNNTFIKFFEEAFLPALQKKYIGNSFAGDLRDEIIYDSITGSFYLAKSLPGSLLPLSESELAIFDHYKNDFNKIAGSIVQVNGRDYNVAQMLQYYNLIKFKGKVGKKCLTSIFEDIMARNPDMIAYRTFINEFDSKYDFFIGDPPSTEESRTTKIPIYLDSEIAYKYLAPLSNPNIATASIIKYKDPETGQTVLLEKQESDEQNNTGSFTDDDAFNNLFDDSDFGENIDEEGDEGVDMYGNNEFNFEEDLDTYTPNYGNYELYNESGVLSQFNDYTTSTNHLETQVIESIKIEKDLIELVALEKGQLKSFIYNGKLYILTRKNNVMKIVKLNNASDVSVVDIDTLKAIIEQKICKG